MTHIDKNPFTKDGPHFEAWDDKESLIMTWLWNFVTLDVSQNCMFLSSSREISYVFCQNLSLEQDLPILNSWTKKKESSKLFNKNESWMKKKRIEQALRVERIMKRKRIDCRWMKQSCQWTRETNREQKRSIALSDQESSNTISWEGNLYFWIEGSQSISDIRQCVLYMQRRELTNQQN